MEDLDRKIFNLLIGIAFSLWRAAFLINANRTSDSIVEKADFFLHKLLADNTIGYSQDVAACEWMSGFYLNNARLRLIQIKKDLLLSDRKCEIDFSCIENNRLSNISNLFSHWDELQSTSSNILKYHFIMF